MKRTLINPWMVRTFLGFAGVSCGVGMVKVLGSDGTTSGSLVFLLFGLALLTGLAKTGTP
jgi:hypothetical protein